MTDAMWKPETIYLTEIDYEDDTYPLVWASISEDSGGEPYRLSTLPRPEDAARIAELEAALASATRGRDDWRDDYKALATAIVGDTGLSAMTVALQAKMFRPRAEKAEARVAELEAVMRAVRGNVVKMTAGVSNLTDRHRMDDAIEMIDAALKGAAP